MDPEDFDGYDDFGGPYDGYDDEPNVYAGTYSEGGDTFEGDRDDLNGDEPEEEFFDDLDPAEEPEPDDFGDADPDPYWEG